MRKWWKSFTAEELSMLKEYVGVFWYEASGAMAVRALLQVIKKMKTKEE